MSGPDAGFSRADWYAIASLALGSVEQLGIGTAAWREEVRKHYRAGNGQAACRVMAARYAKELWPEGAPGGSDLDAHPEVRQGEAAERDAKTWSVLAGLLRTLSKLDWEDLGRDLAQEFEDAWMAMEELGVELPPTDE